MLTAHSRVRGITFQAHPRTTAFPWTIPENASSKHGLKAIDRQRKKEHWRQQFGTTELVTARMQREATQHEWDRQLQLQTVTHLWRRQRSITAYQAWTWYRATLQQLNLYHEGKTSETRCRLERDCQERESSAHIMWEGGRARTAWAWLARWWTGQALDRQAAERWCNHALPRVATRTSMPTSMHVVAEVQQQFGLYTEHHTTAMERIWFAVATAIPTLLWTLRNETAFRGREIDLPEVAALVQAMCGRQVRALANALTASRATRIQGICLRQCVDAMDNTRAPEAAQVLQTASIHFDGGARGNPGPGGSGWTLAVRRRGAGAAELHMSGYKYQGTHTTNNYCEYDALLSGIAIAATALHGDSTHLVITGDSNMIIQQMTGRAKVKATHLQPIATRVTEIARAFQQVTWVHTKRDRNKAADYLANLAMDSKGRHILTASAVGIDGRRFQHVQSLLTQDTSVVRNYVE